MQRTHHNRSRLPKQGDTPISISRTPRGNARSQLSRYNRVFSYFLGLSLVFDQLRGSLIPASISEGCGREKRMWPGRRDAGWSANDCEVTSASLEEGTKPSAGEAKTQLSMTVHRS